MTTGIDIRKRIREYIEIVRFLKKMQAEEIHKTSDAIYLPRAALERLLSQEPYGLYDSLENKLKVWRDLKWIDAGAGRITTQLRVGKKRVPMIKIDLQVANTLEELGGRKYEEKRS